MARYEAGETLASIARTYDCSPPAISYIVSRSRDRQQEAENTAPPAEPQLVKIHATEPVAAAAEPELALAPAAPPPAPPAFAERNTGLAATLARGLPQRSNAVAGPPLPSAAPQSNGQQPNGQQANGQQANGQANGDARRTLHLSLGGNGPNGNGSNGNGSNGAGNGGNGHANGNGADQAHTGNGFRAPDRPYPPQAQPQERAEQPRQPMPQQRYGFPQPGGERPFNESRPDSDGGRRNKDPGTYIDQELRSRVDGDIAVFLAAFDAALAGDTLESRAGLREATDRLLRAGARTRIELERLEARIPLGAREGEGRAEPHWRHR
jgi:hypothetical protein